MRRTTLIALMNPAILLLSTVALAQSSSSGMNKIDVPVDNREVPVHATLCDPTIIPGSSVVDKTKLFFHLLAGASPPVSTKLLLSIHDRLRLVADKNICPQFSGCDKNDHDALDSIQINFDDFMKDRAQQRIYVASNPNVTSAQYFGSANNAYPVYCTSKDQEPVPPATGAFLDPKSPIRVRGISDDLWIDRSEGPFAKSSQATVSYTEDDSGVHTNTTKLQAALGYGFTIAGSAVSQRIVPFVAANTSLTDTTKKPRVIAPANFVAGGILYTALIEGFVGVDQLTFKPQYVDATTMRSGLISLQAIYTPWTRAASSAPFPPLNTAITLYPGSQFFPQINGALIADARADVGFYDNRGDPPFISQNKDFQRFGSRFGYAVIATSSSLPTFVLKVTETSLYGASGVIRNISYFDSSLSISLDPKQYFGFTLQYTNGRDENTYVKTQMYKIGFTGHF